MAKTKEEQRLKKREYDKQRRENMKTDPDKLRKMKEKERLKYLKKKEKKQVKSVSEMSSREHRIKKRQWKTNSRNYRESLKWQKQLEEHLVDNSPPTSDEENNQDAINSKENKTASTNKTSGRKRLRRDRTKLYRENLKLKEQLNIARARAERYKKRNQKLKKSCQKSPSSLTPNSKVSHVLGKEKVSPHIRKRLLFGEVLREEVHSGFQTCKMTQIGRKMFYRVITGKILKKYRLLHFSNLKQNQTIVMNAIHADKNLKPRGNYLTEQIKVDVNMFYLRDDNSRMCPGKKDTITRNKRKEQKRFLNESVKTLHEKFVSEVNYKISYASFARLRPFWVVEPKVEDRNTCACLLHVNTSILVKKLGEVGVFTHKTPSGLLKELCCEKDNVSCLHRKCIKCKNNTVTYDLSKIDSEFVVKQWYKEKQTVSIKGVEKQVKKPVKKEVVFTPKEAIISFERILSKFLVHVGNILHQFRELKKCKEQLNEESAFIHIDFSENYNCKYNEEIQAVHFGGGREQVSLHTGVLYLAEKDENDDGKLNVKPHSFCTASNSFRHDSMAVWAHLKPIFEWAMQLNPELKVIHMQSDGVVNQYKNKTMFHIISNKLNQFFPNIAIFTWNYSESGHGKGAPDGIGGTLKRTADKKVSQGKDIANLSQLLSALRESCQGIKLLEVTEEDILTLEKTFSVPAKELKAFPGTLKVHQVVNLSHWPNLQLRSLSCFECVDNTICKHFHLGEGFDKEDFISFPLDFELGEVSLQEFAMEPELDPIESVVEGELVEERAVNRDPDSIQPGSYVLVSLGEYRYVAVCSSAMDDNGEVEVMFMKCVNNDNSCFKTDENDTSFIHFTDIVTTLLPPNLNLKGNRVFYKFDKSIDINEK